MEAKVAWNPIGDYRRNWTSTGFVERHQIIFNIVAILASVLLGASSLFISYSQWQASMRQQAQQERDTARQDREERLEAAARRTARDIAVARSAFRVNTAPAGSGQR
jgi:hypothetical protein